MIISPTYAKQEFDVINKITEQSYCSTSLEKVELELSLFQGKHFRHLSSEKFFKRITEIATKLKKLKLINSFSIPQDLLSENSVFAFDIKDKVASLEQYRDTTTYQIGKIELQNQLKKGNYCWLIAETKTFYFKLPNGTPQPIPLWTERAESDHIYLTFKVLFEHWMIFGEQVIGKSLMVSALNKLGWDDVNDNSLKNNIRNLRGSKIEPAGLSAFITISYDRKQIGYKLRIVYP